MATQYSITCSLDQLHRETEQDFGVRVKPYNPSYKKLNRAVATKHILAYLIVPTTLSTKAVVIFLF